MAKKVLIECPSCGRINECNVGFFSKRYVKCFCGHEIDVKNERMVTRTCKTCGNLIVVDKLNEKNALCPICHSKLVDEKDEWKNVEVVCPSCKTHLIVNKEEGIISCPICDEKIDIEKNLILNQLKKEKQPVIIRCDELINNCVYKSQITDFPINSEIIVNESEVGVLISNGKVVAIYDSGAHKINFDNTELSKLNATKNDNGEYVSFTSELYFVSKNIISNVKWGTDSKINLFDPVSNINFGIGAYGTFNFKIKNYHTFLFDFVGTNNIRDNHVSIDEIALKIKPNIISLVKTYLPKLIKENNINILTLEENYSLFNKEILFYINNDLVRYGIELTDFILLGISLPEDNPVLKRMKEQYAEKYLKVTDEKIKQETALAAHSRKMVEATSETEIELLKAKTAAEIERIKAKASADAYSYQASAEANEMKMKGYSYNDATKRDVSLKMAENLNVGNNSSFINGGGGSDLSSLAVDSVKANIIKDVGRNISKEITSSLFNDEVNNPNNKEVEEISWNCPNCGTNGITSNFCPNCGTKRSAVENSASWTCQNCGTKEITSNFCPNCGNKKPE